MRAIEGTVCSSFRDACITLHLLADDTEFNQALAEASTFHMPRQLRHMFATICIYCQPSDPMQLWVDHQAALTEDLTRNHPVDYAVNQVLHEINQCLQENGSSCTTLGLPVPHGDFHNEEEMSHQGTDPPSLDDLNTEQRRLMDLILRAVHESEQYLNDPQPRCFFVDAPGGCDKTYLFNKVAKFLKHYHHKVGSVAWTGIATTLMVDGRTVHNLFKLPVPILDTSSCSSSPGSSQSALLRSISLFIVDEASMIPTHALHAIDRCLQDVTGNQVPFRGKVLLFLGGGGGDFRQVLLVVPRVPPAVVIDTCLKKNLLFGNCFASINPHITCIHAQVSKSSLHGSYSGQLNSLS